MKTLDLNAQESHLLAVLSSQRFLRMEGLSNEDIFQFVSNDAFDLAAKIQDYRQVKAFGITYIRDDAPRVDIAWGR